MSTRSFYRYQGEHLFPTDDMLKEAADFLGCDLPALKAIIEVEAAGAWYRPDGSMVARFEPHHLPDAIQRAVGFSGNWRDSLRLGETARWAMFSKAHAIDAEATAAATSWGAFQIMGFNARRSGFASALDMVRAFEADVAEQLVAFVKFVTSIKADGDIRAHSWHAFARKYNGTGQPEVYARKIEAAYTRHSGGKGSPTVLRLGSKGNSVVELQKALASRGYDLRVDGRFGAETHEAVRKFQADVGITVDGVVGNMTWTALKSTAYRPEPEPEPDAVETGLKDTSQLAGALAALSGALPSLFPNGLSDMAQTALIVVAAGLAGVGAFAFYRRHVYHSGRK